LDLDHPMTRSSDHPILQPDAFTKLYRSLTDSLPHLFRNRVLIS
jgi:hypothetical protein